VVVHGAPPHRAEGVSRARRAPEVGALFRALGDPTRREVLRALARAPQRASELAEQLGASRPGMSRHLGILRDTGLVTEDADACDGRARLLRLVPEALAPARAYLDELEGFWAARLDTFRVLADERARQAVGRPAPGRKKRAS
jgi:DNA-binding transcriptional ArsR family regulator